MKKHAKKINSIFCKLKHLPQVTVHDLVLLQTFCRTGLGTLVLHRSKKHSLVSFNKLLNSLVEITGGCLVNSFLSIKEKIKGTAPAE